MVFAYSVLHTLGSGLEISKSLNYFLKFLYVKDPIATKYHLACRTSDIQKTDLIGKHTATYFSFRQALRIQECIFYSKPNFLRIIYSLSIENT